MVHHRRSGEEWKTTEDNNNPLPAQRRYLKAPTIWRQRSDDFQVDSSNIVLLITRDTVSYDNDTEDNTEGNAEGEGITDNNDPQTEMVR